MKLSSSSPFRALPPSFRASACALFAGAFCSLLPADRLRAAETDGQVTAREVALELAGAFSNDGYKIRDGHWAGVLQPGKPQVITVNLYAGNQYFFSLGTTDKARKVAVSVFDENGKPVPEEQYHQETVRAAAGLSAIASGPYYVSVTLLEGEPADFCLLYSYK